MSSPDSPQVTLAADYDTHTELDGYFRRGRKPNTTVVTEHEHSYRLQLTVLASQHIHTTRNTVAVRNTNTIQYNTKGCSPIKLRIKYDNMT